MPLHYHLETSNGVTIVHFTDPKLVPEAGDDLYGLVEHEGRERLLLNFEKVRFLSSNALGILVTLKRKVEAVGGTLKLCCLDPDLIELFRITRLAELLDISDTQEAALRTF